MIRPTLIDLNSVELKCYPFIISLDTCNGSSNISSPKTCVPKKSKGINLKVFNMVTNITEAKIMAEYFVNCYCKWKFNSKTFNSNQKWNNQKCHCECKNYHKCRKDYSWNPSTCTFEKSNYLESIGDTSVMDCDEIILVMDILSAKIENTVAINKTKNYHSKTVRDCCILHTFLLGIILLLIITIISCHFAKHRLKQKNIDALTLLSGK